VFYSDWCKRDKNLEQWTAGSTPRLVGWYIWPLNLETKTFSRPEQCAIFSSSFSKTCGCYNDHNIITTTISHFFAIFLNMDSNCISTASLEKIQIPVYCKILIRDVVIEYVSGNKMQIVSSYLRYIAYLQGGTKKVAPWSFFAVLSAAVWNFNLKFYRIIYWNVIHLSAKWNVILLKNDEVQVLTWPPTDFSALKMFKLKNAI